MKLGTRELREIGVFPHIGDTILGPQEYGLQYLRVYIWIPLFWEATIVHALRPERRKQHIRKGMHPNYPNPEGPSTQ